jgi:hypothetical protein
MESIETERLKLRQWHDGGFAGFARYYADAENAK